MPALRVAPALHKAGRMSHTDLHQLERARAHGAAAPAGSLAATIAELALALTVVGVWWVTCFAG